MFIWCHWSHHRLIVVKCSPIIVWLMCYLWHVLKMDLHQGKCFKGSPVDEAWLLTWASVARGRTQPTWPYESGPCCNANIVCMYCHWKSLPPAIWCWSGVAVATAAATFVWVGTSKTRPEPTYGRWLLLELITASCSVVATAGVCATLVLLLPRIYCAGRV